MPFVKGKSGNPAGRPKGANCKRKELLAARKAAGGKLPLDYLLDVMRDETLELSERLEAAKAAAPYLHRKMPQAIEHSGEIGLSDLLTSIAERVSRDKVSRVVQ